MTAPADLVDAEIAKLPQDLRESCALFFERCRAASDFAALNARDISILVKLVACSDYAARTLLREWDWFLAARRAGALQRQALSRSLAELWEQAAQMGDDCARQLRQFRNRQLLAILWREAGDECTVADSLADLSQLADTLIRAAAVHASSQLQRRFGRVVDENEVVSQFTIVAMGKLGGRELNFSSDVDLIFLYTNDGVSDGPRQLSAQEYFARLARNIIALLDTVTPDGFVYRVDTRLRPFGESGPPVVSFAALESYLLQHGRSWERYAFVKARVIFGDATSAKDLMRDLVEPFVYRRYLDYGVFESLRKMKGLIEGEVRRRELADNIKLGPGGIREIEFIVQSLQLVRGGNVAGLRGTALQEILPRLTGHGELDQLAVKGLLAAYYFLRQMENGLQAMHDRQTHEVPGSARDRSRIALSMGFAGWQPLEKRLRAHRTFVSRLFADVAFRAANVSAAGNAAEEASEKIGALWDVAAETAAWIEPLEQLGLRPAQQLAEALAHFSQLSTSRQIDSIARRRLLRFLPLVLPLTADCDDPVLTLRRILEIVAKILRRSAYVALLNENPLVLERLVELCATSAYLAEEISRFPLLLDEMLDPRLYSVDPGKADMELELAARLMQFDEQDSEARINALAQFQRATLFRIAIADFSGKLPLMHVSDRLTELAEIVLNSALQTAWHDLVSRHGQPCFLHDGVTWPAGFGVVAYGKLAGMEMSYSSDLDLVFLHNSRGSVQQTNGMKPLDNAMFFARLVRRLVHFLTTQTSSGNLYDVDTRLRPSGRAGLLVTSVEAFEKYQEANAWTWEHQALLRSRPVAGSAEVAREFERIRADTLRNRVRRKKLLDDVTLMRGKMREHLDASDGEHFDLKQGDGGIGDIEFLVQYLVLTNAGRHPAVIHYPDNIRQLGTLAAAGCLKEYEAGRLQTIYKQYRRRLHRLALDGKASLVDASEFAAERALVQQIYRREMTV